MKRIYIVGEDPANLHVNVIRLIGGREIVEYYGALLPKIHQEKYRNNPDYEVIDVRGAQKL